MRLKRAPKKQDLPNFKNRWGELGFDEQYLIYSKADQDVATLQQQAEAALTTGANVFVRDPVDSDAAANCKVRR